MQDLYAFSEQDLDLLACFLLRADYPYHKEMQVIEQVFRALWGWSSELPPEQLMLYRQEFHYFHSFVRNAIALHELNDREYRETLALMEETGTEIPSALDMDAVVFYFKMLKLQLLFGEEKSCRKQLRALLKELGSKRRSAVLTDMIREILDSLGIRTFTEEQIPCAIAEASLDSIIVFRLEDQEDAT